MMAGKGVQKSVRLPPDICSYIDSYRGGNFSEKLCNLVYDARKGEASRKERLRDLDRMIAGKEAVYDEIRANIDVIHRIGVRASGIERSMSSLYDEVKRLASEGRRLPGKSPPDGGG